jgi:DNA-binding CsgD family transcriptional regulator
VLDSYTYRFLAELDRLQGTFDRAARQISRIMPDGPATQPGVRLFHNLLETQRIAADLALDRGAPDEAGEWIEAHRRWLDWSGELAGYPRLRLLRARLAELHGDPALARRLAEEALELASTPRQPLAQLEIYLLLARLDLAAGCPDAAVGHIDAAHHIALICDTPYEMAACKLVAAKLASARGQFPEARTLLEAARELAEPLQARPLLDRISKTEQRANAAGEAVALTPRQLEVMHLLATGLTNAAIAERLYLSPRTVDQHVRRIYAALDVSSRAAATRYAIEHGLIESSAS